LAEQCRAGDASDGGMSINDLQIALIEAELDFLHVF
jgi:hypothetical protein